MKKLLIKVDIDTYRGTREGLKPLCDIFEKHGMPALFLFSFGPDNTGKALSRVFQRGFVKKCLRSNVAGNYGLKTLMYGTLLPAPIIYKKCRKEMLEVKKRGFACGIHSWNHFDWQTKLCKRGYDWTKHEFEKAFAAYENIFGESARCCGAAGWQVSFESLRVQDEHSMLFASDARGYAPFFPMIEERRFKTLQIPSTLPTLDEILGTTSAESAISSYLKSIERQKNGLSVMTCHAELEGMAYLSWLDKFLKAAKSAGVEFDSFENTAQTLLEKPDEVVFKEIKMAPFKGRSGLLAVEQ